MTLRDAITEKRREFWKDADAEQMGEELELIVERIDKIEAHLSDLTNSVLELGSDMRDLDSAKEDKKE